MDERDVIARHGERYQTVEEDALRRVERLVMGCDHGASSYTTKTQADQLADLLELGDGSRLLDVGSGAGWPGIYLGATTGAEVVLTDIPVEGLRVASRRIRRERVDAHAVAATGATLPFRNQSFDAVSSSDVFC